MQAGSSFSYIPFPLVPHKASIFTSRNKIFLSNHCTLQWGEVISCGRKLNNEVFQFTSYHNTIEIFLTGRLVAKENLLLKPSDGNLMNIGQLEDYTHQASFLYINETCQVKELTDVIFEILEQQSQISFGISALPVNGFVVRLLGHKAEQLFTVLKQISALIETETISTVEKKPAYV